MDEGFFDELSQLQQQIESVRDHLERLNSEEEDLTQRLEAASVFAAEGGDAQPAKADLPLHWTALPPAKAAALHRLLVEDRVDPRLGATPPHPTESADPAAPAVRPVAVTPRHRPELERQLGQRWLGRCGLCVIILAAVIALYYPFQVGWVPIAARVGLLAVAGIALLAAGELAHRRDRPTMALFAAAGGVVTLYAAAYAVGPGSHDWVSSPAVAGLMCLVTAITIIMGRRDRLAPLLALAIPGAFLTPLVSSLGDSSPTLVLGYLLAVNIVLLTIAARKRWELLPLAALALTALMLQGWWLQFYGPEVAQPTVLFVWGLFVLFAGFAVVGLPRRWVSPAVAMATVAGAAMIMVVVHLFQARDVPGETILLQWLALDIIVLAAALRRGWNPLRPVAWCWTLMGVGLLYAASGDLGGTWPWFGWVWAFYGLATIDILVGFARPADPYRDETDTAIALTVTALAFVATFTTLQQTASSALGWYVLVVAVAQFGLWFAARRMVSRTMLARVYFVAALAGCIAAVPIHFDLAAVAVVWALMSVAAMVLARVLVSPTMMATAIVLMIFTAGHLFATDWMDDAALNDAIVTVGGVALNGRLVLTALLAVAAMLCASLLAMGRLICGERDDTYLADGMLWAGALLWFTRTAADLPAEIATFAWLAPAGYIALRACSPRGRRLHTHATIMLVAAAVKFLFYDTVIAAPDSLAVLFNAQALATPILAIGCVLAARRFADRGPRLPHHLLMALAAVVMVWGGTVEVARYFAPGPDAWVARGGDTQHLACSMWWLICAVVALGLGILRGIPSLRYLALVLFGLTAGKVILLDLSGLPAMLRIATLGVLGASMVFGSKLYGRFPGVDPVDPAGGDDPQADDADAAPE